MRYAISYVSTASTNFPKSQIADMLQKAAEYNNAQDLTGILLCSEGNFFQLIEGDKEKVKTLYSRIEKDSRHNHIIKFLEKSIHLNSYDGYICEVVSERQSYNAAALKNYLHYIEVLDPISRKAVKRVIEAMIT